MRILHPKLPTQEVFHPDFFRYLKNRTRWSERAIHAYLCRSVDDGLVQTFAALRKRYGPLYGNNWHTGGGIKNAGRRLHAFGVGDKTYGQNYGALLGGHYLGGTVDWHFSRITPLEVQADILANPDDWPHVCEMEDANYTLGKTTPWLHLRTGRRIDGIRVIIPG